MAKRNETGKDGESVARAFLEKQGYTLTCVETPELLVADQLLNSTNLPREQGRIEFLNHLSNPQGLLYWRKG